MSEPPPIRLLTVAEVSAMTTLAPSTLYAWAKHGTGPRTFRLGGRRVYDAAEFEAWLEQQRAAGGPA